MDTSKDGNLSIEEFSQLCLLQKSSSSRTKSLVKEETSLQKYFFGLDGTRTLSYLGFTAFVESFKREVFCAEFNEYSGGHKNISSKDFALMILRFTSIDTKVRKWPVNNL